MAGFIQDVEGYYIYKDPNATKEYGVNFNEWLIEDDTIATCVWTVPTGITKDGEGIIVDEGRVWVKLSGGTIDANYLINAHITTAQGRIEDQSFRVVIRSQ